jgi:lipopolysaccharide export LptBFGC system permease protein LptF
LSAIVCIFALYKLKKIVDFRLRFCELFTLIFATFAMFLAVFAFVNGNYFSLVGNILIAVCLGVVVYFALTTPFILKNILPKNRKIFGKARL